MPRPGSAPAPDSQLLERISELEKFCLKLIEALKAAEPDLQKLNPDLYLLPQGTYLGVKID